MYGQQMYGSPLPKTVTGPQWTSRNKLSQFSRLGKESRDTLNSYVGTQPLNATLSAAVEARKARKWASRGVKGFPKAAEYESAAAYQENLAAQNTVNDPYQRGLLQTNAANMQRTARDLSMPYGTDPMSVMGSRRAAREATSTRIAAADLARGTGARITGTKAYFSGRPIAPFMGGFLNRIFSN